MDAASGESICIFLTAEGIDFIESVILREYEARQKVLHDEASMLEGAKVAGWQEATRGVALNLLQLNMDIDTIVQATGLSKQEVLALKK